jgi:hypothetical protein
VEAWSCINNRQPTKATIRAYGSVCCACAQRPGLPRTCHPGWLACIALQAVLNTHVTFAPRAQLHQSFSRTLRSQKHNEYTYMFNGSRTRCRSGVVQPAFSTRHGTADTQCFRHAKERRYDVVTVCMNTTQHGTSSWARGTHLFKHLHASPIHHIQTRAGQSKCLRVIKLAGSSAFGTPRIDKSVSIR